MLLLLWTGDIAVKYCRVTLAVLCDGVMCFYCVPVCHRDPVPEVLERSPAVEDRPDGLQGVRLSHLPSQIFLRRSVFTGGVVCLNLYFDDCSIGCSSNVLFD